VVYDLLAYGNHWPSYYNVPYDDDFNPFSCLSLFLLIVYCVIQIAGSKGREDKHLSVNDSKADENDQDMLMRKGVMYRDGDRLADQDTGGE